MRKILLSFTFILLFSSLKLYSECIIVPLTLQDRVASSSLIIEGYVSSKRSYYSQNGGMILTANTIQIAKIYKGYQLFTGASIEIITLGGQVGINAIKVDPELQLEKGEIGIFMLVQKEGNWVAESGPQGFISIDKHTAIANDLFNTYPAFTIQNELIGLIGSAPVNINTQITAISINSKRSSPTISSMSPNTINAGTSSVLTIKGTNFNSVMDTSSVQFKNADKGGASYTKALKYDYISWSDTMIKVMVRSQAGTGKIRVVIGGNGIVNSTDTLKIPYSHLNLVSGDSIGYETQEIGMNSSNGITWKMNQTFYDSIGARGAFVRSLERWRCGSYINWDTLGHVNYSNIKLDGVNMCAWDTASSMPSGVLAQCFSYYSGCYAPGVKIFVTEMDIRFRIKPTNSTNWNYTSGNAGSTQYHFESVATHELGHGHQLGHVINSAVVMHYSIANGQTKPNLTTDDIAGGTYVINKSINSICGMNAHAKLNSNNCAIVAPNANFTLSKDSICKNQSITLTDSSQGNIASYSWNFGNNASPATANTKGPHNVTYSAGGTKTISLTISTTSGNLTKNKTLIVRNDAVLMPNFAFLAAEKGKVTFTNTSNNPLNSVWDFGDGNTSNNLNNTHYYQNGGTYNVKLSTSNTCNANDTTIAIHIAYLNFGTDKPTVCINEYVTYSDSGDNNVNTYAWSFPGGTPNSASGKGPHKIIYTSPGLKSANLTVTVTGANSNQFYNQSNIVNVNTDTFSEASFIYGYYGKNILGFESQSKGSNLSYKWYFGDGDSSTEKNPMHTYSNANNQTVRLIVSGNCGTDDTTVVLRDFTGINLPTNASFCSIIPNPANDQVAFHINNNENTGFVLSDIKGRTILTGNFSNDMSLDVSSLEAGLYLIRFDSNSGKQVSRLIINR